MPRKRSAGITPLPPPPPAAAPRVVYHSDEWAVLDGPSAALLADWIGRRGAGRPEAEARAMAREATSNPAPTGAIKAVVSGAGLLVNWEPGPRGRTVRLRWWRRVELDGEES